MRYQQYLKKAKILIDEAEKDLSIGCFNKSVSASWFAVEALLRAIVLFKRKPMPERPNKLISQIHRMIHTDYPHLKYLVPKICSLYEHRKRADHHEITLILPKQRKYLNVLRGSSKNYYKYFLSLGQTGGMLI